MKLWALAVWYEDGHETEGVVPTNWLKDGHLHWPNGPSAKRHFDKRTEPSTSWTTYRIIKIKYQSDEVDECHSYNKTSSSEGETAQLPEKRVPKRKRDGDFLYETLDRQGTQDIDVDGLVTHLLRPSPKKRATDNLTNSQEPTTVPEDNEEITVTVPGVYKKPSSPSRCKPNLQSRMTASPSTSTTNPQPSTSTPNASRITAAFDCSEGVIQYDTSMQDDIEPQVGRSSDSASEWEDAPEGSTSMSKQPKRKTKGRRKFPMSSAKFQQKVLHLLVEIKDSLSAAKTSVPDSTPFNSSASFLSIKQIENVEELQTFDPEDREKMVETCLKIGGESPRHMVQNLTSAFMSHEVMKSVNMCGSRGEKIGFANSTLYKIILESIRKRFPEVEATAIRKLISTRLANASKRKK